MPASLSLVPTCCRRDGLAARNFETGCIRGIPLGCICKPQKGKADTPEPNRTLPTWIRLAHLDLARPDLVHPNLADPPTWILPCSTFSASGRSITACMQYHPSVTCVQAGGEGV